MTQTVVAILLACLGAVGFSLGSSFQHLVVSDQGDENGGLSIAKILSNVRSATWMFGTLCIGFGTIIHIVALAKAPVALIQPLGIIAVPITIATAPFFRGDKPSRRDIYAVISTVIGVFGFAWAASKISGQLQPSMFILCASIAAITLVCLALMAHGKQGRSRFQSVSWAFAGGISYGFASGLLKALMNLMQEGRSIFSLVGWVIIASIAGFYVFGAYCVQQAYATGRPETVLAVLTSLDPLIAVIFGFVALGETQGITPLSGTGMLFFASVALIGVALLSTDDDQTLCVRPKLGRAK